MFINNYKTEHTEGGKHQRIIITRFCGNAKIRQKGERL